MKIFIKSTYGKMLLSVLLFTLTTTILGAILDNDTLVKLSFILAIPLFLVVFLLKYNDLNIPFISFLMFSLLGNITTLYVKDDLFFFVPDAFYFLSFMYLIVIKLSKFNILKVDKIIGSYLVLVFLINVYLLYALYGFLMSVIPDEVGVKIFAAKSLILIILAFVAYGVYLHTQTKKSIMFLTAIACFGFSVILEYLDGYYTHSLNFIMLHRILYAVGMYFLFRYATIEAIYNNRLAVHTNEEEEAISDNVILN